MEPIELEPRYSTTEVPGKCLKCLAEQQLDGCLRQLLATQGDNVELQRTYSALLSFLTSPDSRHVRDEAERRLAEGREVKLQVYYEDGMVKCDLKVYEQ